MAIAGQLEVQLLADVARIRDDMNKATGFVTSGAKSMERAAAGVKAALGGIVAGMSIAAMSNWIKGAIDSADSMSKMSQKIGVATKDIAGLQLAYRLAGAGSESMVTSLGRLSKGVVEGNDGLKALGIRTKGAGGEFKATNAVLGEVADRFQKMPDGVQKTALAIEIFGKAGADMIPLLNGGSQGLRDMDEMARKLGLTVSDETGRRAEAFNDTLDLIGQGSQGVARQLMAELLPTLQNLAGSFLTSMTEGDKLSKVAGVLSAALKGLYSAGVIVAEIFSTVGKYVGGVVAAIVAVMQGEFRLAFRIMGETGKDIAAGWKSTASQIGKAWSDEGDAAVAAAAKAMGVQGDLLAAAKAREAAAKAAAAAAKKAAEEAANLLAQLRAAEIGVRPDFMKNLSYLAGMWESGAISLDEYKRRVDQVIAQQPYMIAQIKAQQEENNRLVESQEEIAQAYVAESKAREQARIAVYAYSAGIRESGDRLKLELSLVGSTEAARKRALALYQIELDLKKQIAAIDSPSSAFDAAQREGERARARAAAAQDIANVELQAQIDVAQKSLEEWKSTNKQIADSFVDNLMRGGKNIAQYLKDLFRTLVLRPLLQPIGNMMAGAVNGVMGTGAAQGGMSSLLSGGLSLGSSLMGGASLTGTALGTFGAGFTGGSSAGFVGGMELASSLISSGSFAGGAGAALGAIGPVGWAVLAAAALYSIFGGSKGGPKSEAGFAPGGMSIAGLDIGGNMQGSQRGDVSAAQQISSGISASYEALAKQLGLVNQKLDVGVFYAMDPEGDSMTQLQIVSDTYNRSDRLGGIENVARGEDALKAAIGEETLRVIFEALKASDLSEQYKGWLNALTADATASEMQAVLDRVTKAGTERQQLEAALFELTATDLEKLNKVRDAERLAIDESNRALLEQVYVQQDLARATQGATDWQQAYFASWAAINKASESAQQSASLVGNLMVGIQNKWQALLKSLGDEVDRVRGVWLTDSGAGLSASMAGLDSAALTAVMGGKGAFEAAQSLPQLSRALLAVAQTEAGSFLELRQIQAYTAQTLANTIGPLNQQMRVQQGQLAGLDVSYTGPRMGEGQTVASLVSEVRGMRRDMRAQRDDHRAQSGATVRHLQEMNKRQKVWDGDGLPETRVV